MGGPPRSAAGARSGRGYAELFGGWAVIVTGVVLFAVRADAARIAGGVLAAIGIAAAVRGAIRLSPPSPPGLAPRPDVRRWIFGNLATACALAYAVILWKVIPNRLPSAHVHLWSLPVCTLLLGIGTLAGGRRGWWLAVAGGSALLLSVIVMFMRILISAAFLAGVYGAFGKAASTFALVAIALIVEVVALLPLVHLRFLMSRRGRRAFGV